MAFVRFCAVSLITVSVVATSGDAQICAAGEECVSEESSLLALRAFTAGKGGRGGNCTNRYGVEFQCGEYGKCCGDVCAAKDDQCCQNSLENYFPCDGSCCGNACAARGSKCCNLHNNGYKYPVSEGTACPTHHHGPAPILWATSGGGWRSMMVAMGFANAFESKAKLFTSGRLTNIAANSGGSWFLANFAYNHNFQKKVIFSDPQSLGRFSSELMGAYDALISQNYKGKAEVIKMVEMLPHVIPGSDQYNGLVAVGGHKWLWSNMVAAMLESFPSSKYISGRSASESQRRGLTGPTLHFQSSQLTSAYVKQGSTKEMQSAYLMDGNKNLADQAGGLPTVPTQYIVSGSVGPSIKTGWHYPRSTRYDYHATQVTSQLLPPVIGTEKIPFVPLPASPSIAEVAAASSAVLGFLGSPMLGSQTGIPSSVGSLETLHGLSVCGGPLDKDGFCDLQYAKLADGGFNDNMAVAQSIAVMQDLYGKTHPLKLVLTDAPHFPYNITLKALFDWNASIAPGDFMTGVEYSASPGIHVTSPQVFKAKWSSLDMPGVEYGWRDIACQGGEPCPFKVFRSVVVKTETVDNPAYGVVAGTPIDLLMFQASSSTLGDFTTGRVFSYGETAGAIAGSEASAVFNSWMSESAVEGN